ncbi:integrase, catalytic region, zinc finger, CCHC-type containing protein [Tanacetum coccineum]
MDLEVAFWKYTCFVRDLHGNVLLTGTRRYDLCTISLHDSSYPTPICFMAKASLTQAWLWHHRLSPLKFDTINMLSKKNIINGLPKLKYVKEHLCSSYEMGKAKRSNFKKKIAPSSKGQLHLLHMDLCGPMRSKDQTSEIVRDGENLDNMKEKADPCIFVGYATQSKGYRVYNKRTRLIIETIHVDFDELKDMTFEHKSSGLVLQRQMTSDYDNSGHAPQLQKISVHKSNKTYTSSLQELELLFSPMFEEYFNGGNQGVSKSSALFDNHQKDTSPKLNVQPTSEPSTPTTNANAEENNTDQAIDEQFDKDEFINRFATPVIEVDESSSRNVDTSNMHEFYERHPSLYHWTKDHTLEQVRGNPSKPMQTRRQLATDPKMCMFALIMSTTEPKNIKEEMADHAWIKQCRENFISSTDSDSGNLLTNPLEKLLMVDVKTAFLNGPLKEELYVSQPEGSLIQSIQKDSTT